MMPCPFCGHAVDMYDPDTIYPNGTGWYERADAGRDYCHRKDVPEEQWCYSMHCVTTSGGCGAEISGDTREECIAKWNRRPMVGHNRYSKVLRDLLEDAYRTGFEDWMHLGGHPFDEWLSDKQFELQVLALKLDS